MNPETDWVTLSKATKAELIEKRRLDIEYENRINKEQRSG